MKANDNQSLTESEGWQDVENFVRVYDNIIPTINYYDATGVIHSIGEKKDGRKIGEWRYFHPNETLWAIGEYLESSYYEVKIGDLEDVRLKIFPKEKLLKKGVWKFYNPQKKLRYKVFYKIKNNMYTSRVERIK